MPPQEQKLDPSLHGILRQQARLKNPPPQQNPQLPQQVQRQIPQNVYQETVEDTDTIEQPVETKKSIFSKWWFWLIIVFVVLIIIGGGVGVYFWLR
mgnify:CR=1 FL=1